MPLRCVTQDGTTIHAFAMSSAEWAALRQSNAEAKHLRMPCCGNPVVMKISKLGTLFFAHQRRGPCTSKPESEEHLTLKSIVSRALTKAGWVVATEVRGQTPEGQEWVADVMATRGQARFVVEIQWSRQSDDDTRARQLRYQASGIKALWLFRQAQYPINAQLAAATVRQEEPGLFTVAAKRSELHHYNDLEYPVPIHQEIGVPVDDFIAAVCERRFWFGVFRSGDQVTATYFGAKVRCWKCISWTTVIARIHLHTPLRPETVVLHLDHLGELPVLRAQLPLNRLRQFGVGAITERYSKTEGGSYLANGCIQCNALQGKFFLRDINHRLKVIGTHQFMVTQAIAEFLVDGAGYFIEPRWQLDLPRFAAEHVFHGGNVDS